MVLKIHVKNNRWAEGSFPNTKEGEEVFSITRERFDDALRQFPDLVDKVKGVIDWDTDNFAHSMSDADVLLAWNLPTSGLKAAAPELKWIHIIGAGVEHLQPMDWLPPGVALTNNKGIHAAKAGEFGLIRAYAPLANSGNHPQPASQKVRSHCIPRQSPAGPW